MENLVISIISYAKFKKEIYMKFSPEKDLQKTKENFKNTNDILQKQTQDQDDLLMQKEQTRNKTFEVAANEVTEKYVKNVQEISAFKAKVENNQTIIDKYCKGGNYNNNPTLFHNELAIKIAKAIKELRSEISGESENAKQNRKYIEKYLINFASSWKSFKGSYALNFCLTGGAGVGKTTFAKAIARCFAAFGILATDYIKETNKTDFIGQYVGQSVHFTSTTLYNCLEGICFIDEAYAVGQVHTYGQEFIDELVYFTQKFPGCISIIVAGYEKDMKKHFFQKNEGLNRRFPNVIDLKPYDIATIQYTLVNRVISKLEIKERQIREEIKSVLRYFQAIIQLLYMDMQMINYTNYTDLGNFYNPQVDLNKQIFCNLTYFAKFLYESTDIKKRNILKTYFLKKICGIPEGDLFPNQMGDIQNIVDKILTTDSIARGGQTTFIDILKVFNDYFKIRGYATLYAKMVDVNQKHMYLSDNCPSQGEPGQTRIFLINLCTNSLTPQSFFQNVLKPYFTLLCGDEQSMCLYFTNTADRDLIRNIKKRLDMAYTEAVKYLSDYNNLVLAGQEPIKLSTHVDINFLIQERNQYDTKRITEPQATLKYDSVNIEEPLDSTLGEIGAGTFPALPRDTLAIACNDNQSNINELPDDLPGNDGTADNTGQSNVALTTFRGRQAQVNGRPPRQQVQRLPLAPPDQGQQSFTTTGINRRIYPESPTEDYSREGLAEQRLYAAFTQNYNLRGLTGLKPGIHITTNRAPTLREIPEDNIKNNLSLVYRNDIQGFVGYLQGNPDSRKVQEAKNIWNDQNNVHARVLLYQTIEKLLKEKNPEMTELITNLVLLNDTLSKEYTLATQRGGSIKKHKNTRKHSGTKSIKTRKQKK